LFRHGVKNYTESLAELARARIVARRGFAERDEPVTAGEADLAIPWHIEPLPKDPKGRWAILRLGESFEKSTRVKPTAVFERREDALLACSILPGLGRRLRFRYASDPDDEGFPILDDGEIVGHTELFHEDLLAALNVAAALAAAPRELAVFLDPADRGCARLHRRCASVHRR
jgi:hypothetical protein